MMLSYCGGRCNFVGVGCIELKSSRKVKTKKERSTKKFSVSDVLDYDYITKKII